MTVINTHSKSFICHLARKADSSAGLHFALCFSAACIAVSSVGNAATTYVEVQALRASVGSAKIVDAKRAGGETSQTLSTDGVQTFPSRVTLLGRGDLLELQLTRFLESPTGYVGVGYHLSDLGLVVGLGANGTYGNVSSLDKKNEKYKDELRSFAVGPYFRQVVRFGGTELELRGELNYVSDNTKSSLKNEANPDGKLRSVKEASGIESDLDAKVWFQLYKGLHLGSGLNFFFKSVEDKYGEEYSIKSSKRTDMAFGLNLLNVRVYF